MKNNDSLLKMIVYFESRINELLVLRNGLKIRLSSFLSNSENKYISPKELFCLSLITCFYQTTQKYLSSEEDVNFKSEIKSKILCITNRDESGFYFKIDLFLAIRDFSLSKTEQVMFFIHKKCPISRMLENYKYINLKATNYDEIENDN
ncbi:OsmC family protein [Candidatus Phytoplasma sacchari]|uniref:OsmC family protein n=1 Tax=Candidatus Phytoplasma sacchari TaxID=2609813 RepID=A0ABY7M1X7_9MOLU|nr:OsmC family protein [Candidatus Phytoplasma sacchari]